MKKIIAFLIMLAVFLYFNNSKKIKKEGFYSVSFFYSDNKEKIFEVEDIEIDYFKNIIIKLKKIYNKMELKKIIVYYKDKKIDIFNQKEYQKLIDSSKNSLNGRSDNLHEAEKLLLENLIVSPLYFSVENQYVNSKIRGIVNIPIGNITDLSYAYIK